MGMHAVEWEKWNSWRMKLKFCIQSNWYIFQIPNSSHILLANSFHQFCTPASQLYDNAHATYRFETKEKRILLHKNTSKLFGDWWHAMKYKFTKYYRWIPLISLFSCKRAHCFKTNNAQQWRTCCCWQTWSVFQFLNENPRKMIGRKKNFKIFQNLS